MENNTTPSRLRELHGSGYEIVDGQPNIIGWKIRDIADHRIGVVDDLLFDEDQQKVRYMIANLKDNIFDLDKRKVLIPIGIAQLHETEDEVVVPTVAAWQLRALPTYNKNITDYEEQEVYTVFSTPASASQPTSTNWQKPQNFYEQPSFDHDNMYKRRRSGEMKDKPINRSFKLRDRDTTSDYESTTRSGSDEIGRSGAYERQQMAASNPQPLRTDNDDIQRSNDAQGNEKLLSKIRRMQSELDGIERELRSNRGV